MVADKTYRSDLFYRLNVFPITLPPLRERQADIPLLVRFFAQRFAQRMRKQIETIPSETMASLTAYHWPGNVRELENVIERAVVLTRATRISVEDLPAHIANPASATSQSHASGAKTPALGSMRLEDYQPMPLRDALLEPEKQIILAALQANTWNRQKTAEQLDINRTTLYKKIKQYGLEEYGETA
jgi:DNA-binding NtrC family response regulator